MTNMPSSEFNRYLAAIKTQNGAAMSVGRISTFLDIYIERDLKEGTLTEKEAQSCSPISMSGHP